MLKTDMNNDKLGEGSSESIIETSSNSWFDYANFGSLAREALFEGSQNKGQSNSLYSASLDPQPIVQNLSDLLYSNLEPPIAAPPMSLDVGNLTENEIEQLMQLYESTFRNEKYIRALLVTFAYSIIFFVSLFGNLMVCHIIITNRKLHTFTNCFIANLSVSDLLMTLINVPFGVTRIVLDSWPFGSFFCSFLPFIQATSVYVSTITMCIISIDRYCVVVHPLGPRITNVVPLTVVLAVIWFVSFALATPFAIFNEVTEVDLWIKRSVRCRAIISTEYNKALTMLSFLTQYLLPLTIASVAYASIALSMRQRSKLGAMTREQVGRILKTNRQTITMLVLVLITFAISWLPLHIFCLWRDFSGGSVHYTKVWFAVHWLAMSSVVYNPWIYSARNKHFRNGMKNFFRYIVFKRRSSENTLNGFEVGGNFTTATQLSRASSNRDRTGVRCNSSFQLCHNIHRNHTCTSSFCSRAQACMRSSTSSVEETSLKNSTAAITTSQPLFQANQPAFTNFQSEINGKQPNCTSGGVVHTEAALADVGDRSSTSSSAIVCSSLLSKLSPLIVCSRQQNHSEPVTASATESVVSRAAEKCVDLCQSQQEEHKNEETFSENPAVIFETDELEAQKQHSLSLMPNSTLLITTSGEAGDSVHPEKPKSVDLNGTTQKESFSSENSSSCHNISLLTCSQGELRLTTFDSKKDLENHQELGEKSKSLKKCTAVVSSLSETHLPVVVETTRETKADSNNNEESRV